MKMSRSAMNRMGGNRFLWGSLVWFLLGALCWGGDDKDASQPTAPTAESFLEGLLEIRGLIEEGRAEVARRNLLELLEIHDSAPYAVAKRVEIQELDRRCAIAEKVGEIDLAPLISGEIAKYRASSQRIELRYTAQNLDDFVTTREARDGSGVSRRSRSMETLTHPARFDGTHSIELEIPADELPEVAHEFAIGYGLGVRNGSSVYGPSHRVGLRWYWETKKTKKGRRETKRRHFIKATITEGLNFRDQKEKDRISFDPEKNLVVKLSVGSKATLSINGRKALTGPAPSLEDCGFIIPELLYDRVILQGKMDSAWVENLIETERQTRLASIDQTYDPERRLPNWLFASSSEASHSGPTKTHWIAEEAFPEEALTTLHRVLVLLDEEKPEEAYAALKEDFPPPSKYATVEILRGDCLTIMGRVDYALVCYQAATEIAPDIEQAQLRVAQCLELMNRSDEARDHYATLAKTSSLPEVHSGLALSHLREGAPQTARQILEDATARGISSEEMDKVHRMIVKSELGPNWQDPFEYKTKNYRVITNINISTARKAANLLEKALSYYQRQLERVDKPVEKRFPVYIFSTETEYLAYCGELLDRLPRHTAGLFHPWLKQVLAWRLTDPDELMRTIRHEGVHQYLDMVMPQAPIWFNEGLAEYYELGASRSGLHNQKGKDNEHHLFVLNAVSDRWLPIAELLNADMRSFYRRAGITYPQSWALVQFLIEGKKEHRDLFDRYFQALIDETPLEDLHAEIAKHEKALRRDVAKRSPFGSKR